MPGVTICATFPIVSGGRFLVQQKPFAHALATADGMSQQSMLTCEPACVRLHLCAEAGQPCDTAGGHLRLSRALRVCWRLQSRMEPAVKKLLT